MLGLRFPRSRSLRRDLGRLAIAVVLAALGSACAPNAANTAATREGGSPHAPTSGPTTPSPRATVPPVVATPAPAGPAIRVYSYRIVHTYPHDEGAFTEGLVFDDGVLYEGTGLLGRSTLRRVALESGRILQLYTVPDAYFGEGITVYGEQIIQLTWKSHVGFAYDRDSLTVVRTFSYATEGWGLTHDGESLIMSDGSATLRFLDPGSMEVTRQVEVHDDRGPVTKLNELEYVEGEVFANVWTTNLIARIDPEDGIVTGWIDLTGLLSPDEAQEGVDVLNGIAYDPAGERLFVTGKLWPTLFEIEVVPGSEADAPHKGTARKRSASFDVDAVCGGHAW